MLTKDNEKLLSIILGYGAAFTAVFVLTGVNDPVNVTKFVALGVFACATIGVIANSKIFSLIRNNRFLSIAILIFVVQIFIATFFSTTPLSQNLYGVHGRNNGLFTYLFLIFILLGSLFLHA